MNVWRERRKVAKWADAERQEAKLEIVWGDGEGFPSFKCQGRDENRDGDGDEHDDDKMAKFGLGLGAQKAAK